MAAFALSPASPAVPLLNNGDRLSRDEFERRYEAMPDTRAELIEGWSSLPAGSTSITARLTPVS